MEMRSGTGASCRAWMATDRFVPSPAPGMHQAMAEGLHGARRPRPVADVPPPALADGRVAAKSWLVALVAATPLQAVGALPTARLAAEAPGLCAAMLRAVGSDRE